MKYAVKNCLLKHYKREGPARKAQGQKKNTQITTLLTGTTPPPCDRRRNTGERLGESVAAAQSARRRTSADTVDDLTEVALHGFCHLGRKVTEGLIDGHELAVGSHGHDMVEEIGLSARIPAAKHGAEELLVQIGVVEPADSPVLVDEQMVDLLVVGLGELPDDLLVEDGQQVVDPARSRVELSVELLLLEAYSVDTILLLLQAVGKDHLGLVLQVLLHEVPHERIAFALLVPQVDDEAFGEVVRHAERREMLTLLLPAACIGFAHGDSPERIEQSLKGGNGRG